MVEELTHKNTYTKSIDVIDIPLFDGNIDDATKYIIEYIQKGGAKKNYCISATGAHGLVTSKNDKDFKKVLQNFHINLPDGMPGVWVGKLMGAKNIERCYGPDFFESVMIHTSDQNINHYFCGGKEGVANQLKDACGKKFNNQNIVGTNCPPFRELSDDEFEILAQEINALNTDILWIGISTPKQEKFAYKISRFTNVRFIVTVGAAFDFHIGNVKQAPKYIQKMGLEWFFRLCVEPKRLWKRYISIVPLFIYYNLINILNFNKTK